MRKHRRVSTFLFGVAVILAPWTLPGCGSGDATTAPEAVFKAKKEDLDKASFEAAKAAKTAGKVKVVRRGH